MKSLLRVTIVSILALVGALSVPLQVQATPPKHIAILYLTRGQVGKIYKVYSSTDSDDVVTNWATVKGAGFLDDSVTLVAYAKLYRPAYFYSDGTFNFGTQVDSTGTEPSAADQFITGVIATNGQTLIGKTSTGTFHVSTITGTSNQVTVTNGDGSITLSTPQSIATTSTPTFASQTLTATSNQLVLGTTRTATISAPTPASASRIYTIPDPGAAASFVMTESAQTINGVKTHSSGIPITATTNQLILGGASHLLTISSPAIAAASQTYTIPDVGGAASFILLPAVIANTTSSTISLPAGKLAVVMLTKSSAAADDTIAAPTSGTDDGKVVVFKSTTARAHTISCANAINGTDDLITLGGAIGDGVTLIAYQGVWYVLYDKNATVS